MYDSTAAPRTGKAVSIQAVASELTNEQDAVHALAQLRTRDGRTLLQEMRS